MFVPLCGKSSDMLWPHERGHEVVVVELSPIAVRDFFVENKLKPTTKRRGNYEHWESGRFKILVGDFFALDASMLSGIVGVYDRASLIALPPDMRPRYAGHLAAILPAKAEILLVTLEYPQMLMPGPPFSVGEAEVWKLFEARYRAEVLQRKDILAENPHLRDRGLTAPTG